MNITDTESSFQQADQHKVRLTNFFNPTLKLRSKLPGDKEQPR